MDELLLKKARSGDPDAFEQLMTGELEALVWRICWHYTGNREDASDCGQESMLKIWRGLGSWRGECSLESWICRIAANCCLDFLRRKKRYTLVPLESLTQQGFDPPDPGPGTEEMILRRDASALLRNGIAHLPDDQREALIWTQLEGRSYEETAILLNTSEGTVKSRVNRAKEKLKLFLSEKTMFTNEYGAKENKRRIGL